MKHHLKIQKRGLKVVYSINPGYIEINWFAGSEIAGEPLEKKSFTLSYNN